MNPDFVIDMPSLGNAVLHKLDQMRAVAPVFWSDINRAWIVTGHKEVMKGFSGNLPLSSVRLPGPAVAHLSDEDKKTHIPYVIEAPKTWVLNQDGQQHRRIRRLISRAFDSSLVEAIRPDIRRYIREALDAAEEIRGPFDFVEHISRVIPSRMILKQLSLDDTLIDQMKRWGHYINITGNVDVPIAELSKTEMVLREMREVFLEKLNDRRVSPKNDFMTAIVTPSADGEQLTEEEMVGICTITLIAGFDTTTHTMSLGVAHLASNPADLSALRAAPEIDLKAIMEIQRFALMSFMQSRIATEDFDWNGSPIKAGQFVFLMIGAANRDPSVFPDVERFDITRGPTPNMSFAPGLHHCVGHLVAKMVLGEFFKQFLARFDFELTDERLHFSPGIGFRGLDALNMRLFPRHK